MLSRRQFCITTLAATCVAHRVFAAEQPSWLAEIGRPPKKLPEQAPRLSVLLQDAAGEPITTLAAWQKHRAVLRAKWQDVLGQLSARRDTAPALTVLEEDRADGVLRQRVRYEVEPQLVTEGYLLRPETNSTTPRPGVLVFHSTVNESIAQPAGVKGELAKAFGWQLAKQGYVAFCPRNYLWPDNDHIAAAAEARRFLARETKCLGMAKMLYDAQVALDILAAQKDVDPKRLGAIGHSLGGKEVLYLAAFDERIKSTVSSEGGIGIGFSNWHDAWYLGPKVKEQDFPREHHELLALVAPRAFLLIGGDSADGAASWPFIAAAQPVYALHDQAASERFGLWNHGQGHTVPSEMVTRVTDWFRYTL